MSDITLDKDWEIEKKRLAIVNLSFQIEQTARRTSIDSFDSLRITWEVLKGVEKEYHKLRQEDFNSRCFSVTH